MLYNSIKQNSKPVKWYHYLFIFSCITCSVKIENFNKVTTLIYYKFAYCWLINRERKVPEIFFQLQLCENIFVVFSDLPGKYREGFRRQLMPSSSRFLLSLIISLTSMNKTLNTSLGKSKQANSTCLTT
jgi:hypothetical protein